MHGTQVASNVLLLLQGCMTTQTNCIFMEFVITHIIFTELAQWSNINVELHDFAAVLLVVANTFHPWSIVVHSIQFSNIRDAEGMNN